MADDIDDLLQRTMKTLDDQVPSGYFDDLPQRTLGRLEVSLMQTGSDQELSSGPLATGAPVPPEEDSGLHDIRSLAQTTKQRLSSRKITNTPPADDDLIANSSSGWKAVALPEPAMMISLPDIADLPAKPSKLAEASAVEIPDVTPINARVSRKPAKRRSGVVAIVGVGFAAAAGVVLFVATRHNDSGETPPSSSVMPQRAQEVRGAGTLSTTPPSATSATKATITPLAPPPQQLASDHGDAKGESVGNASGSAAPDASKGGVTGGEKGIDTDSVTTAKITPTTTPVTKTMGKSVPKPPSKIEKRVVDPQTKVKSETTPVKPEVKSDADDGKKSKKAKAKDEEPNFDDLLKEAGETTKKPEKTKLDKTSLSGDDFKRGMGAIAARATACYKGTPGTVAVRVAIGADGHVQKVTVSGAFSGTPSGDCVAAAIKGATFPPWDGSPQSFGYSFLLAE